MPPPKDVMVVTQSSVKRESSFKAQASNILAAKTVADVIRTCLGPSSMLKMLMDPMGGIVLTNDGNAILREIEVSHPAAKSMIELSRAQDEEVGDGTTSVIILTGELLSLSGVLLQERNAHPIMIINGIRRALVDSQKFISDKLAKPIDPNDDHRMLSVISAALTPKFNGRWGKIICELALKAVRIVAADASSIDIKRMVRVEKIPGQDIEDSYVLDGIILNKDITHSGMRRWVENPRIILLDCPLEYKKGESQTNLELQKEGDWQRVLEIEEEQIRTMCEHIIAMKPDVLFTEKGISDLAQHYFLRANITAIRRVRKTDNMRIARAVGASIVNRPEDLKESDVGVGCGLFHLEKIADEYFLYLERCKNPRACSVVLRGASKDILNEIERDLQDALCVTRNLVTEPKLVPGGGATEMALSHFLTDEAKKLNTDTSKLPYRNLSQVTSAYAALGEAMEVIPRTLISNCGGSEVIRTMTALRAKHAEGHHFWGVNGISGKLVEMAEDGIWEPLSVKLQTIKTAVEATCMLLRVDGILAASKKKDAAGEPAVAASSEPHDDE